MNSISIEKQEIINYFLNRGCTLEEVSELFSYCPILLSMTLEEIIEKVTILFNANTLYGIIICSQNHYQCYLLNNQIVVSDDEAKQDYFIQTLIDSVNKQYLEKIVKIQPEDTLEKRLYKMKQYAFNSDGYRLK